MEVATGMKLPNVEKRVVLAYTQGKYAGLRQILGTVSELMAGRNMKELPIDVAPVDFLDHRGKASLAVSAPRFVMYKEVVDAVSEPPNVVP